jgi:uncharacterized MAPEG superfamily protein
MRTAMQLWTDLVTVAALLVYLGTSFYCGRQRAKHGIQAPATTGHPDYERALRIQQNTLENLVVFIPALWMFSILVNPLLGAALGALWIAARIWYAISYARAPESRGPGFIVAMLVQLGMLGADLVQAIRYLPL